jgi:hypothetical protein
MEVRRLAWYAVALLVAGCAHRARAGGEPTPQAETAVKVDNQNFLDMDVYVRREGQRIRIGMVPGLSTRVLMLRPDIVGNGSELQFEMHPIGARRNPISERITVNPGDVIELTIPPN